MSSLAGYLLASPARAEIGRAAIIDSSYSAGSASMAFDAQYSGLRNWERYRLFCDTPLADEAADASGQPFAYSVYCSRSGSKLILLAEKKKIADFVISKMLNRTLFPNLRRVQFHIDDIILGLREPSSEYLVTSLHGRFSGATKNLRTMSLYGADITESVVYREHFNLFNFFSCGIGKRAKVSALSEDDRELIRLGNDGSISTQTFGRYRAISIIQIVNEIIRRRWVDDWVPGIGD